MKTSPALLTFFVALPCWAGDFVNLDFDSPILDRLRTEPGGARFGSVEDLLRGWEVSLRPPLQDWQRYTGEIEYERIAIKTPVALNSEVGLGAYGIWINEQTPPIGQQPGQGGPGLPSPEVRLSTKGTVPIGALTFDWVDGTATSVSITDGNNVVQAGGAAGSLGVQQFAGKEVTISAYGIRGFDVVGFRVIPEPSTWALVGLGGTALLWCGRRRTG